VRVVTGSSAPTQRFNAKVKAERAAIDSAQAIRPGQLDGLQPLAPNATPAQNALQCLVRKIPAVRCVQ
jgi:hypothetical protein